MASFGNLVLPFKECSKGKKSNRGYQKYLFANGEKLKSIEEELKATNDFQWGKYRRFDMYEPKKNCHGLSIQRSSCSYSNS
jgi:hypothetical protein